MIKLTLPEADQIFDRERKNYKLDLFKKYRSKAVITDFAIILGGYIDRFIDSKAGLIDRPGYYWTKTSGRDGYAAAVDFTGNIMMYNVDNCSIGCRPSLPFSSIPPEDTRKIKKSNGVSRIEYGEYPQYAVDKTEQEVLENLFSSNSLKATGRTYTIDSRKYGEDDKDFNPKKLIEYEYKGRKFVRVVNSFWPNPFLLSNGQECKSGDAVWIEVSPLTWLIDKKEDIVLSEKIIVPVQFNKERNYKGNFDNTSMNNFMNTYLIKEINPSRVNSKTEYDNNYVAEVHRIIEEIRQNLKYYTGNKDINELVEKLVGEYNSKIKVYNPQGISLENPNYLITDLINKLNSINVSLKQSATYKKEYVEILEFTNRILKTFDGISNEKEENSLLQDFKLINDIIIPFLSEEEQKKTSYKIRQIILDNKELVEEYVKEIDNLNYNAAKPKYKNKAEYELYIRQQLHPILEEINSKVESKDMAELTKKYMQDILAGNYETQRTGIIEKYFDSINDMIQSIKNKLVKLDEVERNTYVEKLNEIVKLSFENEIDLEQIISNLNNIIKNIYGIELDIDEKIELTQNIDNYKINL